MHRILKKANQRIRPGRLHYGPEWLVLGVNNLCNLHCKMCDVGTGYAESNFYHHLVGARPLNMPKELIFRIFDQAAKYYPQAKMGYAFTEPIIYPHLVESLTYASEKGLFTSITTNALKLRKMAKELADSGLNEIYISLDGPEEIHNEIRGNKKSFQWAVEGMEKTFGLEGQKPEISLFCTITEWNIGKLVEFLECFKGMPLGRVGFMHTNFTPKEVAEHHNSIYGGSYPATESNLEEVDLNNMDLNLLWEEVKEIKSRDWGFPVFFAPELGNEEAMRSFYLNPAQLVGKVCNDAFRNIMIKSDGTVIPAHGRCYRVEAGNLYNTELPEIWNSVELSRFRKTLMKAGGLLPACARCCSAF